MDEDALNVNERRVEQLLNSLTKDLYVWRMARCDSRRGAMTRRKKALQRISKLLEDHQLESR